MRFLVLETTKSASGYANYVKEYDNLDRAKREYHSFLGTMTAESSVLYCMATVVNESGETIQHEVWYAPIVTEDNEVEA